MTKRSRIHNRESSVTLRRELRSNLTQAEALLWSRLKNSKLDGMKFRRQHGIGPYIVDFYCPECRVIVELDGAGHYNVTAQEKDEVRTRFLASLGMRVVRFENWEVAKNLHAVLDAIRAASRENVF
jgi:very-short-patch-repair endonuclease